MNTNVNAPMSEEKNPTSSIISILVIVLILALGAFYFLKQVPATDNGVATPAEQQADPTVSALSAQGTSTDLTDIQKDVNATNLSGIDAGLNDIKI